MTMVMAKCGELVAFGERESGLKVGPCHVSCEAEHEKGDWPWVVLYSDRSVRCYEFINECGNE